jgi:hypothetical protein
MNLFAGWSIRLKVAGLVGTFTLNIENTLLCSNCVLDRVNHLVSQINRHGLGFAGGRADFAEAENW